VPGVSTVHRSLYAVVAIAVAAAVAVVLAFILLVVPLLNAASVIPDGPVPAYAFRWAGGHAVTR
jgi:hypothetical protein